MFSLLKNILAWGAVCGIFFGVSAVGGYVYGYSPSVEQINFSIDESVRENTPLTFGGPILAIEELDGEDVIIKIAKSSTAIESSNSNQDLTPIEFTVGSHVVIEKLTLVESNVEFAMLTNGESVNLGIARAEMGLYISGIVVFRDEDE